MLDPRGQEIRDKVVASFLLLEKERRIREGSSNNTVATGAAVLMGSSGFY